jgi:hypothetical protein
MASFDHACVVAPSPSGALLQMITMALIFILGAVAGICLGKLPKSVWNMVWTLPPHHDDHYDGHNLSPGGMPMHHAHGQSHTIQQPIGTHGGALNPEGSRATTNVTGEDEDIHQTLYS